MEVNLCAISVMQQTSSSEVTVLIAFSFPDCPQPPQPENGGYKCHPSPCNDPLTSGSVIEYLCVEGYMLKGDYKYLTCKNGEWNPAMEVSCRLSPGEYSFYSAGCSELQWPLHWLFRFTLDSVVLKQPVLLCLLLQQFSKCSSQS